MEWSKCDLTMIGDQQHILGDGDGCWQQQFQPHLEQTPQFAHQKIKKAKNAKTMASKISKKSMVWEYIFEGIHGRHMEGPKKIQELKFDF